MKLIDEKGKLFGKLNIIDALVLLVVVLAVALVGFKVWQNHQEELEQERLKQEAVETEEENWLIYTVKLTEVDPAIYEVVERFVDHDNAVIDQMLTAAGLQDGYVVDVEATPHVTYVECEDGTVKRVESSGEDDRLDLVFTCVANVVDFEFNRLSAQEIRAGISHIVKTAHFELQGGKVLSVVWLEDKSELAEVVDLDALNAIREEFLKEEEEE